AGPDDRLEQRVGVRRARLVVLRRDFAEDQALFHGCDLRPSTGREASLSRPGVRICAGLLHDVAAHWAGVCAWLTRSKMRAVHPAISTGGKSSSTMRPAMSFSARAAGRSGCVSTTGLPSSPPSDTAPSIATSPTSGA